MIACGPALRPVLEKWFPNSFFRRRGTNTKYKLHNGSSGQKSLNNGKASKRKAFGRIDDVDDEDAIALEPNGRTKVDIIAGNSNKGTGDRDAEFGLAPPEHAREIWDQKGISVQSEWDVKRG